MLGSAPNRVLTPTFIKESVKAVLKDSKWYKKREFYMSIFIYHLSIINSYK